MNAWRSFTARAELGPGGLRYLLALAVVLFHATRWVPVGPAAVYVFFVLSGYWMSRMYQESYARLQNPLRVYLTSRALRIFPLYLTALAFTLLAIAGHDAITGRHAITGWLELWNRPGEQLRNLVL